MPTVYIHTNSSFSYQQLTFIPKVYIVTQQFLSILTVHIHKLFYIPIKSTYYIFHSQKKLDNDQRTSNSSQPKGF